MGFSVYSLVKVNRLLKAASFIWMAGLIGTEAANVRVFERLEQGETLTSQVGSSIFAQTLIKQPAADVQAKIFSDPSKWSSVFKNVAYAKPYVTTDGKKLVYVKLNGLGDGVGVLMEIKQGMESSFTSAKTLNISSSALRLRNSASEVAFDSNLPASSSEGGANRTVGTDQSIVLEGPLNHVVQLPNMRITLRLGVASYTVTKDKGKDKDADKDTNKDVSNYALVMAKASFATQAPLKELGDYHGFGEQKLNISRMLSGWVLSVLRAGLEAR